MTSHHKGSCVVLAGNGAATEADYCVPADEYEAMLNLIEDAELNAICDERAGGPFVQVTLDDL